MAKYLSRSVREEEFGIHHTVEPQGVAQMAEAGAQPTDAGKISTDETKPVFAIGLRSRISCFVR